MVKMRNGVVMGLPPLMKGEILDVRRRIEVGGYFVVDVSFAEPPTVARALDDDELAGDMCRVVTVYRGPSKVTQSDYFSRYQHAWNRQR